MPQVFQNDFFFGSVLGNKSVIFKKKPLQKLVLKYKMAAMRTDWNIYIYMHSIYYRKVFKKLLQFCVNSVLTERRKFIYLYIYVEYIYTQ